MPRVVLRGVEIGVGRGADLRDGQHAFDRTAFSQPLVVDPVVGFRPDAEFLDVVEVDGGGVALVGEVFQVAD